MLLAFIDDNVKKIILWVVLVSAVIGLLALGIHTVLQARKAKKGSAESADTDENLSADEDYNALDDVPSDEIVIPRNVVYSVGLNGQIRIGKYVVSSADDSTSKFNMRVNGLVREYTSGDMFTLADGDTISPVSGSVVLKRAED